MVTDPNKAQIASSSTNLDPEIFVNKLNDISAQSKNSVDVGITNANPQDFEMSKSPNIFEGTTRFEDTLDCELFEDVTSDFSSASHAEKQSGVTPELLEKDWRINNSSVKHTVKVNTQLSRQDANTRLSQNFGTNNRMLRYRRISSFFYTDYLFVTKKAGFRKASSSQGCFYSQLFVSYKGYVFVVPMKSSSKFPKSLRRFAKELVAPLY